MNDDLKPCPFCGSDHVAVVQDGAYWHAICYNCHVSFDDIDTEEKARKLWNRRSSDLTSKLKEKLIEVFDELPDYIDGRYDELEKEVFALVKEVDDSK